MSLWAGDSGPTVASASDIPGARGQGQRFLGLCLDSPSAAELGISLADSGVDYFQAWGSKLVTVVMAGG